MPLWAKGLLIFLTPSLVAGIFFSLAALPKCKKRVPRSKEWEDPIQDR